MDTKSEDDTPHCIEITEITEKKDTTTPTIIIDYEDTNMSNEPHQQLTRNMTTELYNNRNESTDVMKTIIMEEESVLGIIYKRSRKIHRRVLLVFPATLGIFIFLFHDYLMNIGYITPLSFVCSFILFWNFPQIGAWLQSKPIYVEDLVIHNSSIGVRYSFITYYTYITNFFLSCLLVSIIDYTLFLKDQEMPRETFEVIGTIGGIMALYFKFQAVVGRAILFMCYKLKKRKVRSLSGKRERNEV